MKKQTFLIIFAFLLLAITVVGSTYAFFIATTQTNNYETTGSNFEVIYYGGTEITGPINAINSTDEDLKLATTVNIRMAEDSVLANSTLYVNVETITDNLSIEGFVWEVYGHQNDTQVYYKKGNFKGINSTTNNIVNIVEDFTLSKDNTAFTLYLWLDGNLVDNNVLGGEFKGYIGAQTENFTAEF